MLSSDAAAGLIGAGIGTAATLAIGIAARLWSSQDARARSRRDYAAAVAERLQRMIADPSPEELRNLNHEMFSLAALAVYIPRFEGPVHLWYAIHDVPILQLAIKSAANHGDQQGEVFSMSMDTFSEVRGWARRELKRSSLWFWWQLQTRDRVEWKKAQDALRKERDAAKADAKALRAKP